jgi:hypothetical protein
MEQLRPAADAGCVEIGREVLALRTQPVSGAVRTPLDEERRLVAVDEAPAARRRG